MTRVIDLSTGFSSSSVPTTTVSLTQNNFSATVKPTTGDDSADGYEAGSLWIDTVKNYAYICVDPAVGAAIWRRIDMIPLEVYDRVLLDMSSTNVTTSAYVQIVASTGSVTKKIQAFYPDGDPLIVAVGAAASEVDNCFILAGGSDNGIDVDIPAGSRLSVKLASGGTTNDSGYLALNLYTEA